MERTGVGRTADITAKSLSGALLYEGQPVLTYDISYPEIASGTVAMREINPYYMRLAQQLLTRVRREYYAAAAAQYVDLKREGGFVPFEVRRDFSVMYNAQGIVSLFSDTYERLPWIRTGSWRTSQTWSLQRGLMLPIQRIFRRGAPFVSRICECVAQDIESQNVLETGAFFSNWRGIFMSRLRAQQYYLADDGIVVYYQENQIAPKNTGIVSFLILYDDLRGLLASPL